MNSKERHEAGPYLIRTRYYTYKDLIISGPYFINIKVFPNWAAADLQTKSGYCCSRKSVSVLLSLHLFKFIRLKVCSQR